MSPFMQYGLFAAESALKDANWFPQTEIQKQMTV